MRQGKCSICLKPCKIGRSWCDECHKDEMTKAHAGEQAKVGCASSPEEYELREGPSVYGGSPLSEIVKTVSGARNGRVVRKSEPMAG